MESSFHTFSPYPSQMQDLVVDGQIVGMHYIDRGGMYGARIYSNVTLPDAFMTNKVATVGHSMAKHPSPEALAKYGIWTNAFRFPEDLLGLNESGFHECWNALPKGPLREIRVDAHSNQLNGAGSMVSLNIGYTATRDLEAVINFSIFVVRNLQRLLKRTRTYRDTLEMVGDLDRKEPRPEDIEPLLTKLNDATSWASGSWDRVSHVLEGRLALREHGAMHKVKISCHWEDPLLKSFRLHLEGELPMGKGSASLTPQPGGVMGFVKSLGEVKLGNQSVDDAYLISADDAAKVFLFPQKNALETLSNFESELFLGDHVLNIHATTAAAELPALVELTLKLYRRALLFRLGDA